MDLCVTYPMQDVEPTRFVLVGEPCPSGYVLQGGSHSMCLCNDDIPEILLCSDDQETVIIKVSLRNLGPIHIICVT